MLDLKMCKDLLLGIVMIMFLPVSSVGALSVSLSPDVIRQGDAFLVKVQSSDQDLPTGSVEGRRLFFHRVSADTAEALSFMGLEQKPGEYIVEVHQGSLARSLKLKVLPIKAKTIHLSLPEDKVNLSPEDEERAEREISHMKSFWPNISEKSWEGRFIQPVDEEISTGFGVVRIMNGHKRSVHGGIDFRGAEGTPVRSINSGTVVIADNEFFGGNTVVIDHGEGIFSVYMHLKEIFVKEGQFVNKSYIIGHVGSTGRATGPHLHISVKYGGMTVNPLSLFRSPLE